MAEAPGPIGIAVLGAGMIGAAHGTAYLLQATASGGRGVPVRLIRAVDADAEAAAVLAGRFGFEASGTDWREVVTDERIDAVSVALPNDLHFEVVDALLQAGKHVLCEKPLAITARDALALVQRAAAAGVVSATSFNYRRVPAIAALKARIDAGDLGAPVQFFGHYDADYAADPLTPFSWRYEKRRAGGGALVDIGAHLIDLARFLCGDVERIDGASLATTISRRPLPAGRTTGHERGRLSGEEREVDTDDVASLTLTFTNGCRGTLSMNRAAVGQKNALDFAWSGRSGSARFDSGRMTALQLARADESGFAPGFTMQPSDASYPYVQHGMAVPAAGVPYGYSEIFSFMIGDFLNAIRAGGGYGSGTFGDGYEAALVVEAVERSAATGRAVAISDVRREAEAACAEAGRP